MGHRNDLKPAGEALRQSPLNQQRSRSQEKDPQGQPAAGIAVPEALDDLGPTGYLLDLIRRRAIAISDD